MQAKHHSSSTRFARSIPAIGALFLAIGGMAATPAIAPGNAAVTLADGSHNLSRYPGKVRYVGFGASLDGGNYRQPGAHIIAAAHG